MFGGIFDNSNLDEKLRELKKEMENPDIYADLRRAQDVGRQIKSIESLFERTNLVVNKFDAIKFLLDEASEDELTTLLTDLSHDFIEVERDAESLWLETLLTGKYDAYSAILTVHSGAGGTEANDWADMLLRMYMRFCERMGFKTTAVDVQPGDSAGIKSATIMIEGVNAYGWLRAEKGVHRLVRISPFDAGARRHTSFASIEVMPEIEDEGDFEIDEKDLKIDIFRSGGAGGQHINKTESAVRIKHIPTGIVVECQNERSQIQNKATAMKVLRSRLVELKEEEERKKLEAIQGDLKKIEWGSQIRSYVFQPYSMVKDHRTGYETADVQGVMDGNIINFINDYLIKTSVKHN